MHKTQGSCYSEALGPASSYPAIISLEDYSSVAAKGRGSTDSCNTSETGVQGIDVDLLCYLGMLPRLQDCWIAFDRLFDDVSGSCIERAKVPYADTSFWRALATFPMSIAITWTVSSVSFCAEQ